MPSYNLKIDLKELNTQITDILESDIPERSKVGLHCLLGEIKDQYAFKREAIMAADAIDYLLDDGPLNGDDIEKLVERFKIEIQDRHGDLGEETDTPQPSTNPGNEMRHKQSKHGCDLGKVDIMSRRDDVG